MSERRGSALEGTSRFGGLKGRVDRAAKLIAELREANYSLTSELAALHRKVENLEASRTASEPTPSPAPSPVAAATTSTDARVHEELQALRDERKIIRAKVQSLLERIEKLDL